MYRIDAFKIAYRNVKASIRGQRLKDWLRALLKPLDSLNLKFHNYTDQVAYRLKFSGQQIYLQHYLNDQFDPNNRNVYIDTPPQFDRRPIYTKEANQPPRQVIYRKYKDTINYMFDHRAAFGKRVYRSIQDNNENHDPATETDWWEDEGERLAWYTKEALSAEVDFTVFMPDNITYDTDRLKAEIERYKPAGKNYSIENYTP